MSLEKYKVQLTKDKSEQLNYFNDNYEKMGTTTREQAIEQGLLVEAVQLWVINPKTKQVLMQRRSKGKGNDPDMIDVSVSGHVKANETKTQAMIREASEEIGTNIEDLAGKMQYVMEFEIDLTKLQREGRYLVHEFIVYLDHPLAYYKKQDEEVDKLFFMRYEEVKSRIRHQDPRMRIPYNKETEELLYKIDEKIYNKDKKENSKEEVV